MERDLGRAEGRLSALEHNIDDIKGSLESQGERLGRIERMLSETKGSWRMLLAVAGLAGTIGAGLAKVIPLFAWMR
jgi:hypothetical protein